MPDIIRVGRIAEMSAIGVILLLIALVYGRYVGDNPQLAPYFDLKGETLALIIIGYGFVASVLPVWLLLAPRDYLSTFLKVGTMLLLALGILFVQPDLQMPAVTKFIDGSGPVWSGSPVPLPFHNDRLRLRFRFSCADRIGHNAENDRE